MDHRIDGVRGEGVRQRRAIADIGSDQRQVRSGQMLEPGQDRRRAIGEIIEDDGSVARARQRDDDVRADVAGAAGDQNRASHIFLFYATTIRTTASRNGLVRRV